GNVAMFFRDRDLSDAIGFRYARGEARAAVADLLQRISSAGDAATITLALDGENPWEHYPRSGELFLEELYTQLEQGAQGVQSVLPRVEIEERKPASRITQIHSGSWIDSNFRIWIGHPEDNQAWALLGMAREALESSRGSPDWEAAYQACLVAEGSDWFWWYGDDFTTENAPEFDALFRRNVTMVFKHLGLAPPERLGRPIIAPHKDKTQASAVVVPPRRLIKPVIDGQAHGYYEWSGAGIYQPGQAVGGSMYQGGGTFEELFYGFSLEELFVRLDPARGTDCSGELRILLTHGKQERPLR